MKKIYQLIIACLMLCALVACGNQEESYRDAVKNNDFETAHKVLDEIYDDFLDTWESNYGSLEYDRLFHRHESKRGKIVSAASRYSQAASYVLCAEARYLIANDVEGAYDRIAYLFNEIRIMGEKSDDYAPHGNTEYQKECAKVDCYKQTVKYNNELCDVVLNLAIQHHNKKLAQLALMYYRENGREGSGYGSMVWRDDDKEAAQEKYDEAVANGAFD